MSDRLPKEPGYWLAKAGIALLPVAMVAAVVLDFVVDTEILGPHDDSFTGLFVLIGLAFGILTAVDSYFYLHRYSDARRIGVSLLMLFFWSFAAGIIGSKVQTLVSVEEEFEGQATDRRVAYFRIDSARYTANVGRYPPPTRYDVYAMDGFKRFNIHKADFDVMRAASPAFEKHEGDIELDVAGRFCGILRLEKTETSSRILDMPRGVLPKGSIGRCPADDDAEFMGF